MKTKTTNCVRMIIATLAIVAVFATVTVASVKAYWLQGEDVLHQHECSLVVDYVGRDGGYYWGEQDVHGMDYELVYSDDVGKDETLNEYLKAWIASVSGEEIEDALYIVNDGVYADDSYELKGFYLTNDNRCYMYTVNADPNDDETEELYNRMKEVCWKNEQDQNVKLDCTEESKLSQGPDEADVTCTVNWCESHLIENSETRQKLLNYIQEWTRIEIQDVVIYKSTHSMYYWESEDNYYQMFVKVNDVWYGGYMSRDNSPLTSSEKSEIEEMSREAYSQYLQSETFANNMRSWND